MGDRQIRHVEDIFSGKADGGGQMHRPKNMLDRKSSFNMFKNKQAPRPPQDGAALPKIGNYQPKILLEPKSSSDTTPLFSNHLERTEFPASHTENIEIAPKPMIIGDKDVPLRIEHLEDNHDEAPVPAPKRKRRAPSVPGDAGSSEPATNNPIFGRSMSQRSDEEQFIGFEEQGGDIDFGIGIDNPAFSSRQNSEMSRDRHESSSSWREVTHEPINNEHQNGNVGITYPYIPPPDYEDEEMTLDFEDEYDQVGECKRNSNVYKEYEGEDFGKYIEDDYEFDAPQKMIRPPRHGRKIASRPAPPRNTQPVKTKHPDKKVVKSKKRQAPDPNAKRNTIRDFSFSDSKIGWGDRTVKSTTAKGRYIKHSKDRRRVDDPETFGKVAGPGSYEEFLRVRNGIPTESPNSSDSGVDTSEDRQNLHTFQHSQPKQMRHGHYDKKPTMWQRLTWRFRKNVHVTRHEPEILSERL